LTYEEAEAYLNALGIDAMKKMAPSLHRMRALCEALDHPERSVKTIHVTGTNGKTSTARIAASLLSATGLTVGTYTSPHLEMMRERVALDGAPISEEDFAEAFDHLHPFLLLTEEKIGEKLSYFEVLTALFFLWAAESVDVAVVEVGLGGRWDATNVVDAPVAVITNIGMDHAELLGPDRQTIAREKVGIVKPAASVVTAELNPEILAVLREETQDLDASFSVLGRDFELLDNRVAFGGRYLSLRSSSRVYEGVFLPLHGNHQGVNAATAVEAVTRFFPADSLSEEVVMDGLATVVVPGRLETLRPKTEDTGAVVVDVAHNPDGMAAMITSLLEAFAFETVHFVFGTMSDKDHTEMLMELARVPCRVIVTAATHSRSCPVAELAAVAEGLGLPTESVPNVSDAVVTAIEAATVDDLVCVTGSHYVVGEARGFLMAGVDRS
jgi:dihydrofolate synthase/folylpolyglutamate synthase